MAGAQSGRAATLLLHAKRDLEAAVVTYAAGYHDSRSISEAHCPCRSAQHQLDAVLSMTTELWDTLRPQREFRVCIASCAHEGEVTFLFPAYLLTGGAAGGWPIHQPAGLLATVAFNPI